MSSQHSIEAAHSNRTPVAARTQGSPRALAPAQRWAVAAKALQSNLRPRDENTARQVVLNVIVTADVFAKHRLFIHPTPAWIWNSLEPTLRQKRGSKGGLQKVPERHVQGERLRVEWVEVGTSLRRTGHSLSAAGLMHPCLQFCSMFRVRG
jgi:hypothetical protein